MRKDSGYHSSFRRAVSVRQHNGWTMRRKLSLLSHASSLAGAPERGARMITSAQAEPAGRAAPYCGHIPRSLCAWGSQIRAIIRTLGTRTTRSVHAAPGKTLVSVAYVADPPAVIARSGTSQGGIGTRAGEWSSASFFVPLQRRGSSGGDSDLEPRQTARPTSCRARERPD